MKKTKKIYRDAKLGVSVTPTDLIFLDLLCLKNKMNRSQMISELIRENMIGLFVK